MIRHVVLFKFKPEADAAECQKAIEDLRRLPDKIAVIREFEVGEDVLRSNRSWSVSLVSTFDDLQALETYSRHDDHVEVALRLRELSEAVAVVDSE
jgi:hypothetical protein